MFEIREMETVEATGSGLGLQLASCGCTVGGAVLMWLAITACC